MQRFIVAFIGMVVITGGIASTAVYGSASTAGGSLQSEPSTTSSTVRAVRSPSSTNSPAVQAQPTMSSAPQSAQTGAAYVALGDSVAAGAGLPPLSGTSTDTTCGRSSEAYPHQIAASLQIPLTHLACSGAKVDEGIYGTQVRSGVRVPAQLSAAFTGGTPQIMTVTIGANDIRWNQFIRQCYVTRCGFSVDNARTKLYRADLRVELTYMLSQIAIRSGNSNPPRVLLSGYYSPIASTECLPVNRITEAEVSWLNDQAAEMNQAINSVVRLYDFAEFVPIDFTGHELCSADPWVQGLEAAAPIHPTAAGQTAIAEAFLGAMGR